MCLDGGIISGPVIAGIVSTAIISAITTGITTMVQVSSANAQAQAQANSQAEAQRRNNIQIKNQLDEQTARNEINRNRDAVTANENAQQQILENLRRQGTATASAATAGITGQPLQNLFNEYQVSMGGVSNNLQTQFTQLNENLFFANKDASLQAQGMYNQATPAKPIYQQWSPIPALAAGASSLAGSAAGSFKGFNPGGPRTGGATPLGPVYQPNGMFQQ